MKCKLSQLLVEKKYKINLWVRFLIAILILNKKIIVNKFQICNLCKINFISHNIKGEAYE